MAESDFFAMAGQSIALCRRAGGILLKYVLFSGLVIFSGCKPAENIPAYIRVQSYAVTDSFGQGTASSKVSDVWVNVDNDDRGAYQIPVSIPVLQSGLKTVYLQAGVRENGVSENRLPYPFYTTYKVQTNLVPGELDTIKPVFHYLSNTKFGWTPGDFEGTSNVLSTTAINTASAHTTSVKDSVFEGSASYEVDMKPGQDTFDVQSLYTFSPPTTSPAVWLEMNYKTDVNMDVGMITNLGSGLTAKLEFVAGVYPQSHWNKVYINLGPTFQYWYPNNSFKIYFHAVNTNGGTAHIFLDNLKILYFE